MPSYKLHYFDAKGRAELPRILFVYAGVEFEDVRIPREKWPELKNEMPYKQVPVLEIDGKKLCQSGTIVRYLAREFGLYGKSPFEAAKTDEFADACYDIMMQIPWAEKDEQKKKELIATAIKEKIIPGLGLLEANMGGEYYVGDTLTYADIGFAVAAEILLELFPAILDATPKLKASYERVVAIPSIANWLKKRKTAF